MAWTTIDRQLIHRLFYPVVPVLVTSESKGKVGGMPTNSCMPLSFDPPLVGISVAPGHHTHDLIKESRLFALNWVDKKYSKKVGELGKHTGKTTRDKLGDSGFTTISGKAASVPILAEAVAVAECRVRERYITGDHNLLIAETLIAYASEDFADYWKFDIYEPILYAGSIGEGGDYRWLELKK